MCTWPPPETAELLLQIMSFLVWVMCSSVLFLTLHHLFSPQLQQSLEVKAVTFSSTFTVSKVQDQGTLSLLRTLLGPFLPITSFQPPSCVSSVQRLFKDTVIQIILLLIEARELNLIDPRSSGEATSDNLSLSLSSIQKAAHLPKPLILLPICPRSSKTFTSNFGQLVASSAL